MKKYQLLLLLLLHLNISYGQSETPLLTALNKHAVEITSFENDNAADLITLASISNDKKLIGLGEATHGTREFFLYKARLIRYLIQNHNLKLVLIESAMSGLDEVNNYIQNKRAGDLNTIIKQSSLFYIYQTQEIAALMEWIKVYNQDKAQDEKVAFRGIDMQYNLYIINDILKKPGFVSLLGEQQKNAITDLRKLWDKGEPKLSDEQKQFYLRITNEMYSLLKRKSAGDSSAIYKQDVRLLEQSILLNNRPDIPTNKIRDKFMAENIIWAVTRIAPDEKAVVWAHNGHISHDLWRNYKAMGVYLKDQYKTKYYALGLTVGEGYARLWNPQSPTKDYRFSRSPLPSITNTDAVEYTFKQVKYPNFFLDLSNPALEEPVKDFLGSTHFHRVAGASVAPSEESISLKINVRKSFDGVLFLRNTNEAIGL